MPTMNRPAQGVRHELDADGWNAISAPHPLCGGEGSPVGLRRHRQLAPRDGSKRHWTTWLLHRSATWSPTRAQGSSQRQRWRSGMCGLLTGFPGLVANHPVCGHVLGDIRDGLRHSTHPSPTDLSKPDANSTNCSERAQAPTTHASPSTDPQIGCASMNRLLGWIARWLTRDRCVTA